MPPPRPDALVFITGASSGLGLSLARSVPYPNARVFDVSRRGGGDAIHVPADLSDPAGWSAVAALFEREMKGFAGERIVFVHNAGTLEPMGFAGEVDAAAYQRQVLLNSASLQVLGDAFLRAARETHTPCALLNIGSGAAHNVYEGWSAYCAGKAAADHWVRTVGAEQQRRGGGCLVVSVAPGIVATAMQEQIRATAERDFPEVERFRALHAEGALRDPDDVARELWDLLGSALENGSVRDLRDA